MRRADADHDVAGFPWAGLVHLVRSGDSRPRVTEAIDFYPWQGEREAMLRFGPATGPTVLAAPALFEEGNRTRALLVDLLRRLAERGIASALPDLPGQNESALPTHEARLTGWRDAFAAVAARIAGPVHVVAFRGGALIDAEALVASRWYLSPASGAAQVRELRRVRALGGGTDYGGNMLDGAMIGALEVAEPTVADPLRVVRLEGDPRAADLHVRGPMLWRASEPRGDAALAALLAEDVAAWIARCVG